MRAAAGDREIELVRRRDHGVSRAHQLREQVLVAFLHRGIELDHALGDLGLHRAVELYLPEAVQ